MIVEAETDVLITGQIGPKASKALSHTGIKSYVFTSGTVQEAIQALENNSSKELITEYLKNYLDLIFTV
jgi:predicted Fe-Mo cluster-binding NifX family protein